MSTPVHKRQDISYLNIHYSDVTVKIQKPTSRQTDLEIPQLVFQKIIPESSSKSIKSWDPRPAKLETMKRTSKFSDPRLPSASIPSHTLTRNQTPYHFPSNQGITKAHLPLPPSTFLQTSSSLTDRKPLRTLSQEVTETPKSSTLVGHKRRIQSAVVQQENLEPQPPSFSSKSPNVKPAEKTQTVFGRFQQDKIISGEDQQLLNKETFPLQKFSISQTQFLFDEEIEKLEPFDEQEVEMD